MVVPSNILYLQTYHSVSAFADDHTLYKSYNPNILGEEMCTRQQLENTMNEVQQWMQQTRLKMNTDKTEFILFGNPKLLAKSAFDQITVVEDTIERKRHIRLLGAWLDESLSFDDHVTRKCRSAMANLVKITSIRNCLDNEVCKILDHSLVTSHLDYCNSLSINCTDTVLRKLQRVQNIATKLIL